MLRNNAIVDSRLRFARGVESYAELYLHNASPVNAKLTSPSYIHQYTFLSSATYAVTPFSPFL